MSDWEECIRANLQDMVLVLCDAADEHSHLYDKLFALSDYNDTDNKYIHVDDNIDNNIDNPIGSFLVGQY